MPSVEPPKYIVLLPNGAMENQSGCALKKHVTAKPDEALSKPELGRYVFDVLSEAQIAALKRCGYDVIVDEMRYGVPTQGELRTSVPHFLMPGFVTPKDSAGVHIRQNPDTLSFKAAPSGAGGAFDDPSMSSDYTDVGRLIVSSGTEQVYQGTGSAPTSSSGSVLSFVSIVIKLADLGVLGRETEEGWVSMSWGQFREEGLFVKLISESSKSDAPGAHTPRFSFDRAIELLHRDHIRPTQF